VLLASETLIVVAFAFEKLLEVGFAVKLALKSCKGPKAAGGGVREKTVSYVQSKDTGGRKKSGTHHHLSLALQCLQQKHAELKTWLLATSLSIG